jgi:hypothetical protein
MSDDRVWSIEVVATTRNGNKRSTEVWVKDEDPSRIHQYVTQKTNQLMVDLQNEGLL